MLARTPHYVLQLVNPLRPEGHATIDFETRSAAQLVGPQGVGAWLYAVHPSTEILCMAYQLPGWKEPKLWHMAHPMLAIEESDAPFELFEWIALGGKIEAHNAGFEMCVWEHVAAARMGWPRIPSDRWLCSAAKAAAHSLPRSLEGAGAALNLQVRKDEDGKRLLRKFCQPKRLTKAEKKEHGADAIIFVEDNEIPLLWDYCKQDVRAEVRLSSNLAPLSAMEQRVWHITQKMNFRGVQVDTFLARTALKLATKARDKLNAEFCALTGIEKASQREVIKKWLIENESLDLPNTKGKTLEFFIERRPLSPRAKRVLEIVKEVNRTSTNKFKRMLIVADAKGRARENFVYCGAERTGRYAGKGVQMQNLPKGKFAKYLTRGQEMDIACEDVKSLDLEWCEAIHGDVMNLIASCLRGSIIAGPGKHLVTADYAAIEARCVLWESGATAALEVFHRGEDIYCDMASGIYGRVITKKTAAPINAQGATERDFGKVAVLGLGYGMGWLKFLITLRTYNIRLTEAEVITAMGKPRYKKYLRIVTRKLFPVESDFDDPKKYKSALREARLNIRKLADELEDAKECLHELALCKYTVDMYRSRYPEVKAMWKDQEAAAIEAVKTGKRVKCGVVTWFVKGRFLKCRLPSGRCLNYCDPEIKPTKTSWGDVRPSLRFWGIDQKTKRWVRQASYGGKLVENITQAIARDVMAFAMIAIDDREDEFQLVLTVHDELGAEIDADAPESIQQEFEALMVNHLPPSYAGCPIAAESKRYVRYRK